MPELKNTTGSTTAPAKAKAEPVTYVIEMTYGASYEEKSATPPTIADGFLVFEGGGIYNTNTLASCRIAPPVVEAEPEGEPEA